ncbi:MAG TPA: hypothetical protein VK402_21470 [Blastococcus sp.]|nr:hypothetical protein [Blastococcus sp.]
MSMDRSTTGSTLWRRLALGTGPLKRSSDRLQFLARVLLGCILLTALPIALAVATAVYSQARAEASAQAAGRHEVEATLTEDAAPDSDSYEAAPAFDGYEAAPPMTRVAVVWTEPSGLGHEGSVAVSRGMKAGSTVRIWVDGDGEPTMRPLSDGDITARSAGAALLTFLCTSSVACGLYFAFRRSLDRSRMRRWDADWAVVEPVWTRGVR